MASPREPFLERPPALLPRIPARFDETEWTAMERKVGQYALRLLPSLP